MPVQTGKNTFALHRKILKNCDGTETFAKIVLMKILPKKKFQCASLGGKEFGTGVYILQPKMGSIDNKMSVSLEFCNQILDTIA